MKVVRGVTHSDFAIVVCDEVAKDSKKLRELLKIEAKKGGREPYYAETTCISDLDREFENVEEGELTNNEDFLVCDSELKKHEEEQQAKTNAQRYLHLRSKDIDSIDNAKGLFVGHVPENIVINGVDLDQMIDLEMLTKKHYN